MRTTSVPARFRLANRLERVGFSDIVQIRNKVMELRAQGRSVHQFEGGEPFLPTPQHIKDAMTQALAANKTRYAPSSGIAELRAAIAGKVNERNRIPATVDDVIVVNGGMQGLFGAFQCVLDPGDECLMFSPFWTPIKDLVAYSQATPVFVSTKEARARGLRETLKQSLTPRTKAIYYNTPQNPGGVVFNRSEAEIVAGFAKEHDLIVLADEAYEDLVFDQEHVSIASLPDMMERTITSFTFSKSYAMTGWRLGYVIAKEPWMTGLRKTTLYSTNGVSTPSQWAALAAINTPTAFLADVLEQYQYRRDLLVNGLNALGLTCEMPAGAFYAFPNVSRIHKESRAAAATLLDAAQVATVPGIVFGDAGEGHCRFSFSTAPEIIQAGLDAMKKSL
ncbi:MAG: aminotransferase class I/II-fold pyridoxal phosphate-dependent enzyme [Acidobacteriales bacterium]|nr:aminotransferase class I/II-fold pyridoxal phosphate-dependent enzyme [Terriglobales bacterium]